MKLLPLNAFVFGMTVRPCFPLSRPLHGIWWQHERLRPM